MSTRTKKILVADDDAAISELLRYHLTQAGYDVVLVTDGKAALEAVLNPTDRKLNDSFPSADPFDLLLLDVMMPRLSGIEVTQKVRAAEIYVPILILTARDDEEAKLRGLDFGADDYLEKTTPMAEVVQRIKGLIRRHSAYDKQTTDEEMELSFPSVTAATSEKGANVTPSPALLTINFATKSVSADGQPIELTKREFEILDYLVQKRGQLVSREKLLEKFWGTAADVETRTIDVLISRLRKKLDGHYIESKRGQGVRFNENF